MGTDFWEYSDPDGENTLDCSVAFAKRIDMKSK